MAFGENFKFSICIAILCVLIAGFVLGGGASISYAQFQIKESLLDSDAEIEGHQAPESIQEFEFEVVNREALRKAQSVYSGYLKSIGTTADFSMPAYARYVPLLAGRAKQFLGYYTLGDTGAVCPRLGCEIQIFENFSGQKWRLVLNVFAHEFWIDPKTDGNGPNDIYTYSAYISPDVPPTRLSPQRTVSLRWASKWSWDPKQNKYVFQEKVIMKE